MEIAMENQQIKVIVRLEQDENCLIHVMISIVKL